MYESFVRAELCGNHTSVWILKALACKPQTFIELEMTWEHYFVFLFDCMGSSKKVVKCKIIKNQPNKNNDSTSKAVVCKNSIPENHKFTNSIE